MTQILREKRTQAPLYSDKNALRSGWKKQTASLLTFESLVQLFSGEIPAVILPIFLDKQECFSIVQKLQRMGMNNYAHVNHAVSRMGLAQMEYYLKSNKVDYFQGIKEATDRYAEAVSESRNPVELLMSYMSHVCDSNVAIADEAGYGSMFAGTFRNVSSLGHKHFDYAPIEVKGWDISKITAQLSWNLYLNKPVGGDLIVYERPYSSEDECLRVPGQYYYDDSIVIGRSIFRYSPNVGDVVIFNSRNIHEVERVKGDRFTLSSFIGKRTNGDLVLWS